MENKPKFGIIWDQTGVLYKYGRDNVTKTFKRVFDELGIKYYDEMFSEQYKGTSLANIFNLWKENFNIDLSSTTPSKFSKLAAKYELEILKKNLEKEYDESLITLLKELQLKKIPMIVSTSSTKKRAQELMRMLGLDTYVPLIVSVEDVVNHEPSSDSIDIACKKLNLRPNQCIVIEDAASGIKAAQLAGCKTIGYSIYGEEQFNSLKQLRPDALIKDFGVLNYEVLEKIITENEGTSFFDGL